MPNNTTNILSIKFKSQENRDDFIRLLRNEEMDSEWSEQHFDFNKIVPQPDNIFLDDLGNGDMEKLQLEGRPNWLDWNRENWGTKWNSYDHQTPELVGDKEVIYRFSTAWSYPEPILNALAINFDYEEIVFDTSCEGGFFHGRYVCNKESGWEEIDTGQTWAAFTADIEGYGYCEEHDAIIWDEYECDTCLEEKEETTNEDN